jgi:chemotaxis response regulator CheB
MDFLTPLLALGGLRRTVVTVLEPVPAERARREVEAARTSAAADDELRRRGGFAMTARHRRQAELLARRESELADGHAPYRCVAFVGVSADGPQALEEACRAVEQAAALAQLQLRRLWGQADEAFTWTLPLARGL